MKGQGRGALDPILGPALQLEALPIVQTRAWAADTSAELLNLVERVMARTSSETNLESMGQLVHIAEALGVCTISLIAYSRGRVPKVSNQPPAGNIIVPH